MVELKKIELLNISGGASWYSASFLNAIARATKTVFEIGRSFGTAIRRTIYGRLCPL